MNTFSDGQLVAQLLALAIPGSYAVAALRASPVAPFRSAKLGTAAALLLALLVAGILAFGGATRQPLPVRVDSVTGVMLLLVSGLGLVIVRYSRTYLQGDPGQLRYARSLLATLSAVTTLVVSNHLLLFAGAWTAVSLALHELLTFYRDRPAAQVAAHKKFLVSRLADLTLWSALALIYRAVGSLDLDVIEAWTSTRPSLPAELQLAAVLCVIAASLKCAQLPFHGWLTQVMEAPTPVSALLHAGVVNLGGFLMIRLSPLMARAPAAQLLLVLIGMTTTVVAALVMTTRVSVKVSLAWSTTAQMGFMLVQCGLGAFHLALLHLVAHSLYKAHAFLSAGSAVDTFRLSSLGRRRAAPTFLRLVLGTVVVSSAAAVAVALLSRLLPTHGAFDPSVAVLALVVALSLVPMVSQSTDAMGAAALRAAGVSALYVMWHVAAERLAPPPHFHEASWFAWGLVAVGFVALFVVQTLLLARPHGPLARRLHTWLFAGLYLDERFTRLTFRVWPPRISQPTSSSRPPVVAAVEG